MAMEGAREERPRWADMADPSVDSVDGGLPAGFSASLVVNSFDSYMETPDWELAQNGKCELNARMSESCLNTNSAAAPAAAPVAPAPGAAPPAQPMVFCPPPGGWPAGPGATAVMAPQAWARGVVGAVMVPVQQFMLVPVQAPVPVAAQPVVDLTASRPAGHFDSPASTPQHFTARPQVPSFPPREPSAEELLAAMDSASSVGASEASGQPRARRRLNGKSKAALLFGRPREAAAPGPLPAKAAKRPLPEADEETWEKRHEKRRAAVATVKKSDEYKKFNQTREQPVEGLPAPSTPNPEDRDVSKRHWEDDIRQWRILLRERLAKQTVQSAAKEEAKRPRDRASRGRRRS